MAPLRRRKVTVYEWSAVCRFCKHKWKSLGPKPPKRCARCKKLNFATPPDKRK